MPDAVWPMPAQRGVEPAGCAFPIDGGAGARFCDAPCRPGSAYCPSHHAECHLASGSPAERHKLAELDALAAAVGGRRGRAARQPPDGLLRRLDRIARAFSRPACS